jgi:myosin heavy subunit
VHQFTIKHYAGEVAYSSAEFVFKNKGTPHHQHVLRSIDRSIATHLILTTPVTALTTDDMYSSLVEFIQSSTIPFIGTLFPEDVGDNKKAPTTASTKIRQSANYLVSV